MVEPCMEHRARVACLLVLVAALAGVAPPSIAVSRLTGNVVLAAQAHTAPASRRPLVDGPGSDDRGIAPDPENRPHREVPIGVTKPKRAFFPPEDRSRASPGSLWRPGCTVGSGTATSRRSPPTSSTSCSGCTWCRRRSNGVMTGETGAAVQWAGKRQRMEDQRPGRRSGRRGMESASDPDENVRPSDRERSIAIRAICSTMPSWHLFLIDHSRAFTDRQRICRDDEAHQTVDQCCGTDRRADEGTTSSRGSAVDRREGDRRDHRPSRQDARRDQEARGEAGRGGSLSEIDANDDVRECCPQPLRLPPCLCGRVHGDHGRPARVVAIGDIHGSLDGLVTILTRTGSSTRAAAGAAAPTDARADGRLHRSR